MRYNRVLLVNPRIKTSYMGPIRPPASLGYIGETLGSNEIQYDALDMNLGYREKKIWRKIEEFKPDLIGVTVWTYRYKDTYDFIERIRERYPYIKIVTGGPHISTLRANALKKCRAIDYGVVLEGEATLLELCRGHSLNEIKGLLYYREGSLTYNGDREFVSNLDTIHFPKYNKFKMRQYFLEEILIISSRGCPFSCIYCPVKLAIGKKLRVRSAKNVVSEIEYWYNKGYRKFNFGDDNFTFSKNRVYEICDQIEKRGFRNLDLRCGNGVRADRVDTKLLKRMKDVGFGYIGLGVEAGSNRILKMLRKQETVEDIESVIKDACRLGYDVTLFFLVGSPGESYSDIMDSVKLAKKYPVMDARFYNIIPYPATELFEWIKKKGFFLQKPEDYLNNSSAFDDIPVFETPQLSAFQRTKVLRHLKPIQRSILKRSLRRKLKRYGFLGRLISVVTPTRLACYLVRHNRFIRRVVEKIRDNTSGFQVARGKLQ